MSIEWYIIDNSSYLFIFYFSTKYNLNIKKEIYKCIRGYTSPIAMGILSSYHIKEKLKYADQYSE